MTYLAPTLVLLVVLVALVIITRFKRRVDHLEALFTKDLCERLETTKLLAESMRQLNEYQRLLAIYERVFGRLEK